MYVWMGYSNTGPGNPFMGLHDDLGIGLDYPVYTQEVVEEFMQTVHGIEESDAEKVIFPCYTVQSQ